MTLILSHKFRFLPTRFKNESFNLLDIGAGSHSATKTMSIYPQCNYYGVDITRNYENDETDFKAMKEFYQMDLTALDFTQIPDHFFDVIIMSHIIEHLYNGNLVIEKLLPKLKKNGSIYIEYPSKRSTKLPSMKGTLNFYDDPTHVRLYSIKEIADILKGAQLKIIKAGTRKYWPYILFLPINIIKQRLKYGYVPGGVFWDITGFAEYIYAKA